ncbi:MAG: type VI secretion system contractile sheath large subunit [Pseudomonadota bacterium]
MAEPAPEDDPVSDALSGITRADVVPNAPDDTDDILAGLEPVVPVVDATENLDDILNALDVAPEPGADAQDLDDILGDLGVTDADDVEAEAMSDALNSIDTSVSVPDTPGDDIDDILAGVESPAEEEQEQASAEDIFSSGDKLAEEGAAGDDVADVLVAMPEPGLDAVQPSQDLDSLLSDLSVPSDTEKTPEEDLNGILGDLGGVEAHSAEVASGETDLDALLSDLGGDETEALTTDETEQTPAKADGLDDLLSDLGVDTDVSVVEVQQDAATDDLDALLSDLAEDEPATATEETDDLDALLSDLAVEPAKALGDSTPGADAPPTQSPFGTLSALRPERANLHRPTFRMALFGDFTGRSVRGVLETGDALASRKPIELDVDTVEEVIEGFATTLRLPIGRDGDSINVKLGGLDDLHPDELYDNVEIFEALAGLRQQLEVGSIANSTIERLKAWSEAYGTPVQLPKHSGSTSVPAHLKLSDFQALIGDTEGAHGTTSPVDEMIAKIVGPHIVKAPDAGVDVMKTAVDAALSGAMRLVLHHPDFQAIEAQWRSLDLLARRLETDSSLQIVLYDVSAEELAADLAAQEDLAESGIFRLLTEVLDPEEGAGGFSALFGLYTFEETPPHAELLARIGQVAAHIDAPFFAAMAPTYLDTAVEDRHPLVAKTWDTLRTLPEAAYIGLASPRFLLRQPYGAKSDPISPFAFEEFTPRDGLRSLLWANPVVLVAVLLAATYKKDGKAMGLGSLMSLGDLPFHYVTDRHGDQVALPSTERNLTSAPTQSTLARGYMPVVWMKGRNEVRLGSFRSLGGDEIAGPWSSEVPAPRSQSEGNVGATIALDVEIGEDNGESLDDLLAGFEDDLGSREDTDADAMDADLAALLEGL